jgi:cytochrome c-type biogenesis protein CcsB
MVGDKVLPSERMVQTELFYNALRSQKWPVFLSLSLSLLLCIALLGFGRKWQWLGGVTLAFAVALFVFVTLQLALRWLLSGHIPVSNGPETMLFMAWVVLLLPVVIGAKAILKRKHALHSTLYTLHLMAAFTPLVASFCLLVAMLGGSSSQLSPLMPVLQSPLLSIHVMTVMCAYSLFALQMLLGIYALFIRSTKGTGTAVVRSAEGRLLPEGRKNSTLYTLNSKLERVTALSQLLLYPAVFLLTIGIFLGAVWANVSWGTYWSWDPKESWALITLLVYSIPLHAESLPWFRSTRNYRIYSLLAFACLLMTYLGVNYLLGGMHSYN